MRRGGPGGRACSPSTAGRCDWWCAGPRPGGIAAADVARALGLPLLAAMRPEPRLDRRLERGVLPVRPRGPLAGAARAVLAELRAELAARSAGA